MDKLIMQGNNNKYETINLSNVSLLEDYNSRGKSYDGDESIRNQESDIAFMAIDNNSTSYNETKNDYFSGTTFISESRNNNTYSTISIESFNGTTIYVQPNNNQTITNHIKKSNNQTKTIESSNNGGKTIGNSPSSSSSAILAPVSKNKKQQYNIQTTTTEKVDRLIVAYVILFSISGFIFVLYLTI